MLDTATMLADYFIENTPQDDYVPFWDFDAPPELEFKDSSAAAIATSGLLELSTLVDDDKLAKRYFKAAEKILKSLSSKDYLARGTPSHGIINHGVQNYRVEDTIDVSLSYGDYYFIEALLRYEEILDDDNGDDNDRDGDD